MTGVPRNKPAIFRQRAVEEARSEAVRGGLLRLTPPWTVGLFLSLTAVVALATGVAIFGTVRIHSSGRGIVQPEARVLTVRAPVAGIVDGVLVREGERVHDQQLLVSLGESSLLANADRANLPLNLLMRQRELLNVRAAESGVIDRLLVRTGRYVAAGDPVATIVPGEGTLLGYLALPARDWPYLHAGAPVALKFDAYPWQEMGVGWGRVVRVGADTDPEDGGTARSSDGAARREGLVRVVLAIERLPQGAPPRALQNGLGFTGEVTLRTARIYELILTPLARTPAPPAR